MCQLYANFRGLKKFILNENFTRKNVIYIMKVYLRKDMSSSW